MKGITKPYTSCLFCKTIKSPIYIWSVNIALTVGILIIFTKNQVIFIIRL